MPREDGGEVLEKSRIVLAPPSHKVLFERAAKECRKASTPGVRNKLKRRKTKDLECVSRAHKYIVNSLRKIYERSPFIDKLHPFYRELVAISIDTDRYKQCLAAIATSEKILEKIYFDVRREILSASEVKEVIAARRAYFGRTLSVLKRLDKCLRQIRRAQKILLQLPEIEVNDYTVVIAGAPNVGKSSLLRALSRAKPEVKPYPFTTKSIIVGHIIGRDFRIQLLDTPGLLDTPLSEKNRIERQAILAMRHVANIILYVVDVTERGGFTIDFQKRVYDELREGFPGTEFMVVFNKIDAATEEDIQRARESFGEEKVAVSALTGENVDELRNILIQKYRESRSASLET